ncbi:MAG TPA: LLM class flavin-dependent oxidoreductase, partial [Candidatus Binataceae bacterium]
MANQRLSLGFTIPQRGIFFGIGSWSEMLALACAADQNPLFDSVWVGDSVMAKPRPESIALLGALASATSRVKLGVGCMASFPIRDPIIFAHQWATLDLISAGRMRLAVCTGIVAGGVSAREGGVWGIPDGQRGARMAENIAICRRLWNADNVSFEGKYRSFKDVTISPRPVQQPCPIWIAANPMPHQAAVAMRRVAQIADGWMSVEIFPDLFKTLKSQLDHFLRDAGQNSDSFPNIAYHNVNINSDQACALEESKRFLDAYYGPVFAPQMIEAWTAAGSPERCAEQLRKLSRDGAKAITLRITSWDQRGQFERLL